MTVRQPRYSKGEFTRGGNEICESQVLLSDAFKIGDIVVGRIIGIEQTGVLVDFNLDRPIYVPLLELSINEIEDPEDALQANEFREFLVIGNYDGKSDIFFSHCSPETLKDSSRLEQAAYQEVALKYSYDVCELGVILHTKILKVHGIGVSARLQWFLGSQEHPPTVSFSIRQLEIKKAWERVQQLHTEEVILSTKVIKKGTTYVLVEVEGLIGSVRTYVSKHKDELAEGSEVSLRIMAVEEEYNRIVLIPYE
jgi:small subunit ribosomal protein S1